MNSDVKQGLGMASVGLALWVLAVLSAGSDAAYLLHLGAGLAVIVGLLKVGLALLRRPKASRRN